MTLCTPPLLADEGADLASVIRDDWVRQAVAQNVGRPLTAGDDAAGGCDGIKDGTAGFHTQKQQNPWWQVDLGSVVSMGRIVRLRRVDGADRDLEPDQ